MKALRVIWSWLWTGWTTGPEVSFRIDTHQWDNKMETLRMLSHGCSEPRGY